MYRLILVAFALLVLGVPVAAETVDIPAGRDATLIEDPDGALGNGSGTRLFAGRTNQETGGVRRAVLYFDVASALPEHALVEAASLTLYLAPSNPGPRDIRLHRLLADWGEGASASSGGLGAPAQTGDVTWLHRFFDREFWVVSGGQFVGSASATRSVDEPGFYTWSSTNQLVADVRMWSEAPGRNFGWIVMGDETQRQTSKSFASREEPDDALRPVLSVTYRVLPGRD